MKFAANQLKYFSVWSAIVVNSLTFELDLGHNKENEREREIERERVEITYSKRKKIMPIKERQTNEEKK